MGRGGMGRGKGRWDNRDREAIEGQRRAVYELRKNRREMGREGRSWINKLTLASPNRPGWNGDGRQGRGAGDMEGQNETTEEATSWTGGQAHV